MKPGTHVPVMLAEVLKMLPLSPGRTVVDGTVGLGGHAEALARRVVPGGRLIGFDLDATTLPLAESKLRVIEGLQLELEHADFREIPRALGNRKADAILLDLGVSSAQLDDPERGLGFTSEGPLDMRLDTSRGESAAELLNRLGPDDIERILRDLGDERFARAIARAVVARRPLSTTSDLVACVLEAIPPAQRDKRIHPATRTFQAVRIAVNRELEGLADAVRAAAHCLAPGGAIAVISFHSGEDREVKRTFRSLAGKGFEDLTPKPLTPTDAERRSNPRSRSAKLRALRRAS